ncbi:MAG: 30S ribosome-binding factor RbfA [Pseudomonadota bacterium]|nr:30S ribosome-binding factor RbfA [Pseudomonadota bacterium]
MPGSAPSQRQLRAGELVRHALAEVFARGETGDPVIERIGVTVVEVAMSPDLRIANAYVRPFLTGEKSELAAALERSKRHIRGLISPRLTMKFMPELRFHLDTAVDYAAHVDALLNDPAVRRDLDDSKK